MEENRCYTYGLRIAAISSRKFGDVSEGEIINQFLYNGKEMLDEDADLGWIDYGFRNYDPQIGRFPQLDPLADEYPFYTPYQYAGNEPITNIDIDGLEPGQSVLSTTLETAKTLETIVITGPKASNNVNRIWGLVNVIGSTLEVAGGVALGVTTAWTGFGAVTGGAIAVHGLDGLSAGLTQLITGKETRSYSEKEISKGFQKAGISKENADIYAAYGNDALSMALTGGAGKLLKFTKAPVKAIPKAKVVPKVNNGAAKGVGKALNGVDDVLANPNLLQGKSLEQVQSVLGNSKNWVNDVMRKSIRADGWVLREMNQAGTDFTGRMIQYHPGTPRHFGGAPYWKVSSGNGTFRIPLNP
jgi:RHS repeat-associated protein